MRFIWRTTYSGTYPTSTFSEWRRIIRREAIDVFLYGMEWNGTHSVSLHQYPVAAAAISWWRKPLMTHQEWLVCNLELGPSLRTRRSWRVLYSRAVDTTLRPRLRRQRWRQWGHDVIKIRWLLRTKLAWREVPAYLYRYSRRYPDRRRFRSVRLRRRQRLSNVPLPLKRSQGHKNISGEKNVLEAPAMLVWQTSFRKLLAR